ncbi:MAG: isochorismate synthase, partial [Chlorobiales bacterium]|nr:isochorismate synthase [Chlorobiales bacterium]
AEPSALPTILSRQDTPEFSGWRDMIEQSLKCFANGEMEKIVLARKTTIKFDRHLQPFVFMRHLRRDISRAFHFYFQPCANCGFIGATPERLYKRTGRTIETEAVAGTRPRSAAVEEDERLGNELLNSEKDAREHDYVRQTIRQVITDLCDQIEANGEVTLLKLSRVQHLYNRFKARLLEGCSDAEILQQLHPTPAVGGVPKAAAVQKIAMLEPFDRGWYTGPVGWVSRNGAEFAVALRCGLIEGDRLHVFTGAGIVQGSDPESEWAEIEDKLASFLSVTSKNGR